MVLLFFWEKKILKSVIYLETALRCQGYSVEVAQSGEEVLAYLQGHQAPVSAVVLDVIMPGRDGIDALREIRRLDRNLPVIVISGASSPGHRGGDEERGR